MGKVFSVTSVQVQVLPANPAQAVVTAHGFAPTSGWKNIDLVPIAGSDSDGVLDLDFSGTPPTGLALQVLTPVTGDYTIADISKLTGVMVHARTNSMTALIGQFTGSGPSPAAFALPPGTVTTQALGEEHHGQFTSYIVGEETIPASEDIGTLAARFAESPPLTLHAEKYAYGSAEKLPTLPSEKYAVGEKPPMLEKLAHPETGKAAAAFGENGPGPDPGPMHASPFGTR